MVFSEPMRDVFMPLNLGKRESDQYRCLKRRVSKLKDTISCASFSRPVYKLNRNNSETINDKKITEPEIHPKNRFKVNAKLCIHLSFLCVFRPKMTLQKQ